MENIKKELQAFKKATRLEVKDVLKTINGNFGNVAKRMDGMAKTLLDTKQTMDSKFQHMGDTMENGFDRLIVAIDQFGYVEKDLESLEDRVSNIEKRLDSTGIK